MLLDPAKSAEPPIKVLFFFIKAFNVSSDAFLVAKSLNSLSDIFFCSFRTFLKSFFKILFIFFLFFLKTLFHLFSSNSPFFPIFLHSFSIFFGISKGLKFQFKFFLTSFISSKPNGLPCEDACPDLFGEP